MTLYETYIVFPNGDKQEISHNLTAGMLVDLNGYPLTLPLPTIKMLAYHVSGKSTREERGVITVEYRLEQLSAYELLEYV